MPFSYRDLHVISQPQVNGSLSQEEELPENTLDVNTY